MRIVFNHKFGHQEQGEFFHCDIVLLDVSESDHDLALAQGFLKTVCNGEIRWYQNRSTRINCLNTNFKSNLNFKLLSDPLPLEQMDQIYTSYCVYKNFSKYFEVGEYLPQDFFIGYYHDNEFIAWSKLRHYSKQSIETCQFVWNYENPSLYLGSSSLECEIAWAKDHGYTYVYLGPGYEKSSCYKSKLEGFEWWNGYEWSNDKDEYNWLCNRDSKLHSISDLYDI